VLQFFNLTALMAPMVLTAATPTTPVSLPLNSSATRFSDGAARTVQSILEFSRWPSQPDPVRLCIVGPALHADRLGDLVLSGGRAIERRNLSQNAGAISSLCDALYIGQMDQAAMRRLTARVRGTATVTIAENDPECRSEAMFCLIFEPRALSFQINVDAVSRSVVRIDPRVLRMSKGGY
jgi:hypothetical protein